MQIQVYSISQTLYRFSKCKSMSVFSLNIFVLENMAISHKKLCMLTCIGFIIVIFKWIKKFEIVLNFNF